MALSLHSTYVNYNLTIALSASRCKVGDNANEEAFRRIILASLKVEQLKVCCSSLSSQYAAVAKL